MSKLFLFVGFLLAVAARGNGNALEEGNWHTIGSVRVYPDYIHRCSAVHLFRDIYITTARCVAGFENSTSLMHLLVNSSHLYPDAKSKFLDVKEVFINPNYTTQPFEYNFGLIRVSQVELRKNMHDISTGPHHDLHGHIFFWRYDKDFKEYSLTPITATAILRKTCSNLVPGEIGPTLFCVKADNITSSGPVSAVFDEGTPAISRDGYLGGFYGTHRQVDGAVVFIYLYIQSVRPWIDDVISHYHNDYDSRILPAIVPAVVAAVSARLC